MTGERDRVFRALHDMRGSIIALVDAESGEIVQETEYSAFGEVVAHSGAPDGTYHPIGFAGGLYDPSTGLRRFGAPDYDAQVGRWLDLDPNLGHGGLWNLYDDVAGVPSNRRDPTRLGPHTTQGPGGSAPVSGAMPGPLMCIPLSPSVPQAPCLAALATPDVELVATAIEDGDGIERLRVDRDTFFRRVRGLARAECRVHLAARRAQGGGADALNRCVRVHERSTGCMP